MDLGLAVYERMTIDHVLRAGAESAMADQGEEEILEVLERTAAKNFVVSSGTESVADGAEPVPTGVEPAGNTVALAVDRYCACPESPGAAVGCSTTCADAEPTLVSYRLSAAKTYEGMILPSITFSPAVDIQVR